MYQILIANGVNLDLLGSRPKDIYGEKTLKDLETMIFQEKQNLQDLYKTDIQFSFFQSNDEAEYLQTLSGKWDGAVLNPGAWTHTSLALADRLEALQLPFIEVHLSQLARREDARRTSYLSKHALGVIYGLGFHSYVLALHGLLRYLQESESVL